VHRIRARAVSIYLDGKKRDAEEREWCIQKEEEVGTHTSARRDLVKNCRESLFKGPGTKEAKKKEEDARLSFTICLQHVCVCTVTETVGDVFSLSARLEFSRMTFRLIGNSLSACSPFLLQFLFYFFFPVLLLFVAFPGQRERKWGAVSHPQMQNKATAFQEKGGMENQVDGNRSGFFLFIMCINTFGWEFVYFLFRGDAVIVIQKNWMGVGGFHNFFFLKRMCIKYTTLYIHIYI